MTDTSPATGHDSTPTNSSPGASKRRKCVSTACIACRKRKSKACVSVYNTPCVYDPNSDHRRKGVYRKDGDSLKTRDATLQTLVQAVLNFPEDEVDDLVKRIRACDTLDKVADWITTRDKTPEEDVVVVLEQEQASFESKLANQIGELRLDDGTKRVVGGTSTLLFLDNDYFPRVEKDSDSGITNWTNVTNDADLIRHLLNHYFTWHYTFFTILPRLAFERDFATGSKSARYCSPILVNAMLALGCHFTSAPGTRTDPDDSSTAGDHFFNEAKRLIYEEDLLDTPRLTTVQALALMSVREAGCAREARGWVYSGMAFRMACDLGLSFSLVSTSYVPADDEEEDARRITFWGCFMIDKCWSNYLGRLPMFQTSANVTVSKFDVFPSEDASAWAAYSGSGFGPTSQPSRLRAVALQISALCDISSDLIKYFYHPEQMRKPTTKHVEMKRLGEIHGRLEEWRRNLPKELEPKEGTLSSVIIMQ